MGAATPYARELDARTGDVALDGDRHRAGAPLLEVAKRVVRTPLGRFLPDPTFGVDYAAVERAAPEQRPAALRDALVAAFRRWTDRGVMVDLTVKTEAVGRQLRFSAEFYDSRAPRGTRPLRVTGVL